MQSLTMRDWSLLTVATEQTPIPHAVSRSVGDWLLIPGLTSVRDVMLESNANPNEPAQGDKPWAMDITVLLDVIGCWSGA